jgi:hypothetical protein
MPKTSETDVVENAASVEDAASAASETNAADLPLEVHLARFADAIVKVVTTGSYPLAGHIVAELRDSASALKALAAAKSADAK